MISDSCFLKACRRQPVDRTPVWMMRQAGRYLPEYRAIRAQHSFLEMCRTPELAAEVTVQPLRRFDFDAAIIFADILLPLPGMGIDLSFAKGEGPVIGNPVRTAADVDALTELTPEVDVPFLAEAIGLALAELRDRAPLIGFSGAPFTLASYVIEGGGSKNFIDTKTLMYTQPEVWHRFMDKVSSTIVAYLRYQIAAGVHAVQLFDSWVGILSPADYREYVLPYSSRVIAELAGTVPIIHFGTDTATLLPLMRQAGGDVLGVDWRIDLADAWQVVGPQFGVQGNLDPITLFAPPDVIVDKVQAVLTAAAGKPGHIFNLGHGVLPETPLDSVAVMVDAVHRLSAR
jgi:uroporphyrinogen decarboxylase